MTVGHLVLIVIGIGWLVYTWWAYKNREVLHHIESMHVSELPTILLILINVVIWLIGLLISVLYLVDIAYSYKDIVIF